MNLNGHWGLGGPYDPEEEGLEYRDYDPLDCPECGKPLDYDYDIQKYRCTNDICTLCNNGRTLTADDVAKLYETKVAEMSTMIKGLT